MKVLLSGPYSYKNENISGGVEAVLENLSSGFSRFVPNIDFQIVSGSFSAQKAYEIYNGITYIKKNKLKFGSVFISQYPYRIKSFLKKSNHDLLNSHSLDFAYYGLKERKKLIFTLHGITWKEKNFLPKYKQPLWNLYYVKRLKILLKNLKYLVSINPYVRELVKEKTEARIFDICNPISDRFFEIPNKCNENRMFYLGIISRRKNLLNLIKSLSLVRKEVKNFKLIVAGKIVDKMYFEEIINYIKKHDLNDYFEFMGTITDKQKLDEYSKMSVLVLNSFQETAPMVISEAFAAGKPVIASNICGIPYMVQDGKNGFTVNPNNIKDIAEKIIYIFENPDEVKYMGIKAQRYAKRYHSVEMVVRNYKSAYEEILSKC